MYTPFVNCSREGLSANQALRVQFSSGVSSALEDAESASKNLLSSIDRKLSIFVHYRRMFDSCCY